MEPLITIQGISVADFRKLIIEDTREVVRQEIKAFNEAGDEKLIRASEAKKLFNPSVTEKTLTAWAKAGRFQQLRIGRSVFYKKSEILSAAKGLKKYSRTI